MDFTRGPNLPLAIGGVLVFIIAGAMYFFFALDRGSDPIPKIDSGPDVAAQVSGAVETPADKLPETNPFSGYKNPFE
ncbi:MAG: hypothetical protein Q7S50_04580 [bacterium]|nr:hypothetical protein [bacterium]